MDVVRDARAEEPSADDDSAGAEEPSADDDSADFGDEMEFSDSEFDEQHVTNSLLRRGAELRWADLRRRLQGQQRQHLPLVQS